MATSKTAAAQQALVSEITQSVIASLQTAGAVQVASRPARPRPTIVVRVNEGNAVKYGELTIGKEAEQGGFLPKMGLHVEDVESLIKLLRAAKKEATTQG